MTCQDCIHYKSIGTLCDKFIYPEERNNEPCDYFEKKQMTCQDCIYFNANKHPTINGVVSIAGHCDKRVADGYDEYPMSDCDVCDMFEPTHESVGNALDALDSWESISK